MRGWRLRCGPPTRHPDGVSQPIPVQPEAPVAVPVGPVPEFELQLPVFEGPLPLLLHLIESQELDILTVPLASVADAYVAYLERHPVEPANLAQFVALAAQLILLKSRSLLPTEPALELPAGVEDIDEEELRRRLIAYRAIRDAAAELGARDGVAPMWRREPRQSDLPEAPLTPLPPVQLAEAMERLAAVAEPEPPPPEVVAREVTVGQQVAVLRAALAGTGKVVLQAVLAAAGSRTERVVTLMAALELIRRRELRARQRKLFGPILLESVPDDG
jgi:segregation and condensation protein A